MKPLPAFLAASSAVFLRIVCRPKEAGHVAPAVNVQVRGLYYPSSIPGAVGDGEAEERGPAASQRASATGEARAHRDGRQGERV